MSLLTVVGLLCGIPLLVFLIVLAVMFLLGAGVGDPGGGVAVGLLLGLLLALVSGAVLLVLMGLGVIR